MNHYDIAAYIWPAYTGDEPRSRIFWPEAITKALQLAKEYADQHLQQPPLITINSWNEWTESSYLQPDDRYGYGYLDAVKKVFGHG